MAAVHAGALTLGSDELDGLGPNTPEQRQLVLSCIECNLHDQSINRRDIVSHPSIHSIAAGVLEVGPQL